MSKIFDNIADVEKYLGTLICIPRDIPEDATILCYSEDDSVNPYLYKENQDSLQCTNYIGGGVWRDAGSKSLEEEVEWDVRNGYKFAYLRLTAKDNSDVFTPERLLGVETDKGFVEGIASVDSNIYLITGSHIISASRCKFYISDDSDETVSFEEYVNKFYDGGICGNKQGKVSCL